MGHAEVLELIEIAAAEPEGLARLTAGDTPEAAAVAGHIAGCDSCAAELARTARTAAIVREAIREVPDPALRARTLAFVREVGVERAVQTEPASPPVAVLARSTARSRAPWWAAASIAAVLIAGVAGFAAGGAANPGSPGEEAVVAMAATQTTMHIAEQTDVVHLALAPTGGGMAKGTVLYSVASGELSMTATNLEPAPAGSEYACWVEQNGQRRRIGLMYVEGRDGSWAGRVAGLADLGSGAAFGVTVVPASGGQGTPILRGGG